MNIIDMLIICLLIYAIVRGVRLGLVRQGLSLVGFIGGLFVGSAITRLVLTQVSDTDARAALALLLTLGTAVLLASVGEAIGYRFRGLAERYSLGRFDDVLGGILEVATVLTSVWLLSSLFLKLPVAGLRQEMSQSQIIQSLDQHFPSAPPIIAEIEQLIAPNGFPSVFIGPEPLPTYTGAPSSAQVSATVATAGRSVVKVQGLGCGGLVTGSGFVVGPGLVATNAHVVAGVHGLVAIDANGTHAATPIWFDPDLDFAVLRTQALAGPALAIASSDVARGTSGAVLGFPGGGPFDGEAAVVLQETTAIGRDIYDQGTTRRSIYVLQANVEPGNSGGPLVLPDGTVVGVVFAKSVDHDGIGYALTSKQILPEIQQAQASTTQVSTGSCASS